MFLRMIFFANQPKIDYDKSEKALSEKSSRISVFSIIENRKIRNFLIIISIALSPSLSIAVKFLYLKPRKRSPADIPFICINSEGNNNNKKNTNNCVGN